MRVLGQEILLSRLKHLDVLLDLLQNLLETDEETEW